MIPEGRYDAVAKDWDFGNSSQKGTEQVLINFEIVGGDFAGYVMPWFGYFTPNTEEKVLQTLRNCGWTGDDITELDRDGMGTSQVSLVVQHETDQNGKIRAKVEWVNRPGGGRVTMEKKMTDDAKRALAARVKAAAQAIPVVKGKPIDSAESSKTDAKGNKLPF